LCDPRLVLLRVACGCHVICDQLSRPSRGFMFHQESVVIYGFERLMILQKASLGLLMSHHSGIPIGMKRWMTRASVLYDLYDTRFSISGMSPCSLWELSMRWKQGFGRRQKSQRDMKPDEGLTEHLCRCVGPGPWCWFWTRYQ
jgi:hypothetical protein